MVLHLASSTQPRRLGKDKMFLLGRILIFKNSLGWTKKIETGHFYVHSLPHTPFATLATHVNMHSFPVLTAFFSYASFKYPSLKKKSSSSQLLEIFFPRQTWQHYDGRVERSKSIFSKKFIPHYLRNNLESCMEHKLVPRSYNNSGKKFIFFHLSFGQPKKKYSLGCRK